jgi:transcriptional regulator with XRE-family HTH domain
MVDVPAEVEKNVDGSALRAYRKRIGMTQEQMAERLEVTKATVNKWENGKQPLPGTVKFALEAVG